MEYLIRDDPEVARIIQHEESRIENTLDLIAAENHAPRSVLEAQGSIFSTKAAEGYPGRRFHAGCIHADELESLAIARAKRLFGADHANLQPHSGVSANLAVYFSVLEIGDRILSMKLSHGGHLSHGDPSSVTSHCFEFQHYGLNRRTELIDYDEVRKVAESFKPKMIIAGASSYPRLIDYKLMAEIARSVSAFLLVDMAHIAGLVAAGVIPSPVPHADFITFTTYKTLRGGARRCYFVPQSACEKNQQNHLSGRPGNALTQFAGGQSRVFQTGHGAGLQRGAGRYAKKCRGLCRGI